LWIAAGERRLFAIEPLEAANEKDAPSAADVVLVIVEAIAAA